MNILRCAITYPPQWNGLGVCDSWSILGKRQTSHPELYKAAHVRTNPFYFLFFWILIFGFFDLLYGMCAENRYEKNHTLFFDTFFNK